jgi:hypothetical protein
LHAYDCSRGWGRMGGKKAWIGSTCDPTPQHRQLLQGMSSNLTQTLATTINSSPTCAAPAWRS